MVVASMILTAGALGIFGDMKQASTKHAFPRVSRTEQEQTASVQGSSVPLAGTPSSAVVARGRSGDTDPCIPVSPVTFSALGAVMC